MFGSEGGGARINTSSGRNARYESVRRSCFGEPDDQYLVQRRGRGKSWNGCNDLVYLSTGGWDAQGAGATVEEEGQAGTESS